MLFNFKLPFLNGSYRNGVCRALWAIHTVGCKLTIDICSVFLCHFAEVLSPLSSPHSLQSGGILIIGQKQDSMDSSGVFNDRKAFSGKVAHIQLWNGWLMSEDIKKMANCQSENIVSSTNQIITW